VDILTTLSAALAALAAVPALDGFLRWRRLTAPQGAARAPERAHAPGKILAVIPSRGEGARVGDLAEDLRRQGAVDVLVLLDGPDPDAEARLARDGVHYLSKKSPGPSKGHALAFLAESMRDRLNAYDFILVFDADMRLPEGFFRDLHVPEGVEVFQLPVRPAGVPAPGAPRVEALSLAEARLDDLARSAAGQPVRLRGKAMGFSPRAFRLGPASATRTTAEDSEAALGLLAHGIIVHALDGPFAFDEPPADTGAMGRSRARWFGGHLKLLFAGFVDLVRSCAKRPAGTFVLAADLWLRPRILLLGTLAFLAAVSDLAMVVLSSSGAWAGLAAGGAGAASAAGTAGEPRPLALLLSLVLLSLLGKSAFLIEWLSVVALRQRIGYPSEVPAVSAADFADSILMWGVAVVRGALSPGRWHRARPEA
jgi:cellulose synthase/poly-beta-1,6-N-acetylglucosamine synthase-like glycosyltransferase